MTCEIRGRQVGDRSAACIARGGRALVSIAWLVAGCGRLGFDATAEPAIEGTFSASPHREGREREIKLEVTIDNADSIAQLVIWRAPGVIAPEGCPSDSVLVTTEDGLPEIGAAMRTVVDRIDDPWNRLHSYRLCLTRFDGTNTTAIVERVAYFNPGPGCLQPPCEIIGSRSPASQFVRGGVASSTGIPTEGGGDFLLADLDADGHLDAVLATVGLDVWQRGDGAGAFGLAQPLEASPTDTQAAVVGDFNNDNVRDIVAVHRDQPGSIYIGTGTGFTAATIDPLTYASVYDVDAADLDGDGFLDLVVGRFGAADLLYRGTGTGSFLPPVELRPLATTTCVNCVKLADVDGDGPIDALLAYNTDSETAVLLRGTGNGTFESAIALVGSFTPVSLAPPIDVDHDGDVDIVAGQSQSGGIYLSLATTPTSLAPFSNVAPGTGRRAYGLAVADLDGDTHPDILTSDEDPGPLRLLRGVGDGTFLPAITLDGGTLWPTANIELGDVDEDGRLDFAIGHRDGQSQVFLAR